MIQIETNQGARAYTKAVFIWTGHINSGWPTSFTSFSYNDVLNGLLTYGHDDEDVSMFSWFIPNGSVGAHEATMPSPIHALEVYKAMYGDRLIIWMNPKEDSNMLRSWVRSDLVLTPLQLGLEPFAGSTRKEFQEWAHQYFDKIASMNEVISLTSRM